MCDETGWYGVTCTRCGWKGLDLIDADEHDAESYACHGCALDEQTRWTDALIAIVAQPWVYQGICPSCDGTTSYGEATKHREDCAWLIAARALGIA